MPDINTAGVLTAGKPQVKALQKRFSKVTVDTATIGQYGVCFGDNPEITFLETVGVETPFAIVNFAIMPINAPFLFCLANMDRYGVYLNVKNTLVYGGKTYPVVRKWGHPWLLLDDQEAAIAYFHFIKGELRQLYRRFGHSAAERLHKVLARAGYDDINESVVAKINKYCHLCQLHGGAPGRFRFTIRNDVKFNYKLIVNVMYINGKPMLHAINEATAFQAAKFL
jgi:hypothetical protein